MSRCGKAALAYAAIGWIPLPTHWVRDNGSCSCPSGADCGNPGKHPLVKWKDRVDPPTEYEIRRDWQRRPFAQVCVKTGAESGIAVLDVDPRHGGDATLERLAADHGPLPVTRTVETGGGGLHLYFAHPGFHVGPSAGKLGEGLDVRCDQSIAMVPPSMHASGRRYRWVDWSAPIAEMPAWLADVLRPPPPVERRPVFPVSRGRSAYVDAALEGEARRVADAVPSQRNHTLYCAAANLGELVGAGVLEDWRAAQVLLDAAPLAADFPEAEVRATILSGLNKGAQNPRPVAS